MLGHFYVQYSKIGVIQGVTLTVFHFFHSPEAYPELMLAMYISARPGYVETLCFFRLNSLFHVLTTPC